MDGSFSRGKPGLKPGFIVACSARLKALAFAHRISDHATVVFPPYLSPADGTELAERINIPRSRFVDLVTDTDPFSSSVLYGLEHALRHKLVQPGDIGLIISVGSGLQVGCATYRF